MMLLSIYRALSRLTGPWTPDIPLSPPRGLIWFHGASAGEITSLLPLIRLFIKHTDHPLLLTAMTPAGVQVARKLLSEGNRRIRISRFPYDHPGRLQRLFRQGAPRAILIAEAEIWPNLLLEARKRNIPVYLVNARISERTFRKLRVLGGFYPALLSIPRLILAQSERHRERFLRLGVLPARVRAVGNLKFDTVERPFRPLTREALGLPSKGLLVIWGSLREGEEEIAAQTAASLLPRFALSFALAPRHAGEIQKTISALRRHGIPHHRRSRGGQSRVLVLDTMGELWDLYHIGDIAIVGGTFSPHGGHSPLEPAFCGLAVVFGPFTWAIKELVEGLIRAGGGVRVSAPSRLPEVLEHLLQDPVRLEGIGAAAHAFAESGRGVAHRIYRMVYADLNGDR